MTCLQCQSEIDQSLATPELKECPSCSSPIAGASRDPATDLDGPGSEPHLLRWATTDSAVQPAVAAAPARCGHYLLQQPLGQGGMGIVFRARDERMHRDVALKLLARVPGREARWDRFRREAEVLARLDHANVIPIFDIGNDERWSWIAMPLLAGSLAIPPGHETSQEIRNAVELALQAAEGLAHAHSRGVLHRDVKPSNLLLDETGRVRVADFGLAHLAGAPTLTRTGDGLGTPAYVSPEQSSGQAATPASDVYGLGATLFDLLTGGPPPPVVNGRREALTYPRPLHPELRAILEQSLDLDAARRYPTMDALASDLRAWLAGTRVAARQAPRWSRAWARRLALPLAGGLAIATAAAMLPAFSEPRLPTAYVIGRGLNRFEAFPGSPAEGASELSLRVAGRDYELELEHGWRDHFLRLRSEGRPVAELLLDEKQFASPGEWQMRRGRDEHNGQPLVLLERGLEDVLLTFEPQSWGPTAGWRTHTGLLMTVGSPALADWDGDGADELLVAGLDTAGAGSRSKLLVLDLASGALREAHSIAGAAHSTPQFMRDPDGRVVAAFIDTDGGTPDTPAHLWRFAPDATRSPTERRIESEVGLSWPLFLDVDGDGEKEVIIAARGRMEPTATSAVYCFRGDLQGEPLWTHVSNTGLLGYLAASDQDGDGRAEVCYTGMARFDCLKTGIDIPADDRVLWSAFLEQGERIPHQPVEVGDFTGDGISELAGGTNHSRVIVVSRSTSPELLWGIAPELPRTQDVSRNALGSLTARLAVRVSPETGTTWAAASSDQGPAFLLELSQAGPKVVWVSWQSALGGVGSPSFLDLPPTATGCTEALLFPSIAGPKLVDPRADPPYHLLWSVATEGGTLTTPVAFLRDGSPWLAFTDELGYIYAVPVTPPAIGR